MSNTALIPLASTLPEAWRSTVIARLGTSQLKVLRMDASAYPDEIHPFDEALLVIDGLMRLSIAGRVHEVRSGEVYIVPAGQAHAVAEGSFGTLVIIDQG